MLLAIETAMRRSEIAGLLRSNINFKNRTLILPDTKNGESRVVPLSSKAVELLSSFSDEFKQKAVAAAVANNMIVKALPRSSYRRSLGLHRKQLGSSSSGSAKPAATIRPFWPASLRSTKPTSAGRKRASTTQHGPGKPGFCLPKGTYLPRRRSDLPAPWPDER